MKRKFFMLLPLVFILIAAGFQGTASGDTCVLCHGFNTSLHHSFRGMEYWYLAETNGIETIAGYPYTDFIHADNGCKNCHRPGGTAGVTCATCHGEGITPENPPEDPVVVADSVCLGCHARESAMYGYYDDVHRDSVDDDGNGTAEHLTCQDCHSSREMHGDGNIYVSHKEPGAMDTKCENCHTPPGTTPHIVHGTGSSAKLDCKACHQRSVISCYNCHLDTAHEASNHARVAYTQIKDWVFLMNGPDGKVTSANMQNFVAGDLTNAIPAGKTFLLFAPMNSHAITKEGRPCSDCHGTAAAKKIYNNRKINLTWLDVDGKTLIHRTGVIPVAEGTKYKFIAYDKDNLDGTAPYDWTALSTTPLKPDRKQYRCGFGTPLTRNQMLWLTYTMP
jgi:hypothetical protein